MILPDRGALHLQQGASWPQSPEKANPGGKKFSTVSLCLAVDNSSFYGIISFFKKHFFACRTSIWFFLVKTPHGRLRNSLVDDLLIEIWSGSISLRTAENFIKDAVKNKKDTKTYVRFGASGKVFCFAVNQSGCHQQPIYRRCGKVFSDGKLANFFLCFFFFYFQQKICTLLI